MEFMADDVGGETGAKEATVEGRELSFVEVGALPAHLKVAATVASGAAEGAQLALDALADDGGFVGVLGSLFEGGFDVAVRDAAGAEVACHTKLALLSSFGALAGELLGVAGVVDVAVLFKASDHFLDEVLVGSAADEGLFHFGHGMSAAHKDFDGSVVQGGFGFDLAWLGKHEKEDEVRAQGSKEVRIGSSPSRLCSA